MKFKSVDRRVENISRLFERHCLCSHCRSVSPRWTIFPEIYRKVRLGFAKILKLNVKNSSQNDFLSTLPRHCRPLACNRPFYDFMKQFDFSLQIARWCLALWAFAFFVALFSYSKMEISRCFFCVYFHFRYVCTNTFRCLTSSRRFVCIFFQCGGERKELFLFLIGRFF